METNDEIGIDGFKKIFRLADDVQKSIDNYKNKKTIINFKFDNFSKNKVKYKKLKFPSINKEFIIDEKKPIKFEYINNIFPYKNEITEKIILSNDKEEQDFLIHVKRHHDNYYNISVNIENEKSYSLEIVFYFKEMKTDFGYIMINDNKIINEEYFKKTQRYNLVNVNIDNVIKFFDNYSDNKIDELDQNHKNDIFKNHNLFFNFIYGDVKRIGKIFNIKEDKKIADFNEEEKNILKKINKIVPDENIYEDEFSYDFESLWSSQIYFDKDTKEKHNYLEDLNNKFIKMPILLKYYDVEPTDEDIKIIRALTILNIILFFVDENRVHNLRKFIKETNYIFEKKDYLNNKDKIMIYLNYLTIIKRDPPEVDTYKFESFYELSEKSIFIKSELLYREIISKLTEDSSLFFFYLQLDSGADVNYFEANYFYKIEHISLEEIKTDLLSENFYPHFFTFCGNKNLMAWNDSITQIKNYNCNYLIYSSEGDPKNKRFTNDTVKMTFIKFHEYSHTKFKGDYQLLFSPRFLFNNDLNRVDNKKKLKESELSQYLQIAEHLGESGQTIEKYIFGDENIINNIIYSTKDDLSKLYNSDLYVQNDFSNLHKLIEKFKINTKENKIKDNSQQSKIRANAKITIPKLKIQKDGKYKIYTYADLNISSNDLWV